MTSGQLDWALADCLAKYSDSVNRALKICFRVLEWIAECKLLAKPCPGYATRPKAPEDDPLA
jgi:hypothetical protein